MYSSPDVETFRIHLLATIDSVKQHRMESHADIKIQSLLNLTIYVMGTRFLEASIKHIVYNCATFRGDTGEQLENLETELKHFNNPEFANIRNLVLNQLQFDIMIGQGTIYQQRDVSFLNEIVNNRHKNVHAAHDHTRWYNQNQKDLTDFEKEFEGLERITAVSQLIPQ